MEQHREEMATIESIDSGAVYTLALKTHVGMSIDTFRYFAGWCDKIQVNITFYGCLKWFLDFFHLGIFFAQSASLQRGKTSPHNKCPGYDSKQSVGEVPVMLKF